VELHDAVVPGVRPPSILRSLGKLESDYTVGADFSDIHWFNTIKVSRQALEASLGPAKVDTRARNLYLLGMSMSPLFDISNASDFVRALLKLLDDWEAAIVEGGKGVVRLSSRLCSDAPFLNRIDGRKHCLTSAVRKSRRRSSRPSCPRTSLIRTPT